MTNTPVVVATGAGCILLAWLPGLVAGDSLPGHKLIGKQVVGMKGEIAFQGLLGSQDILTTLLRWPSIVISEEP